MKGKNRLEKQASRYVLVHRHVLGWMRKRKRDWSWQRDDGIKGTSATRAGARRALEATEPSARALTKAKGRKGNKVTKPATKKRARLEITAANLYSEAAKLPASSTFHGLAFLAPLLERFGTTPQAARSVLVELHRDGEITLRRLDLVDAVKNHDMVRDSAITAPGSTYEWHMLGPKED